MHALHAGAAAAHVRPAQALCAHTPVAAEQRRVRLELLQGHPVGEAVLLRRGGRDHDIQARLERHTILQTGQAPCRGTGSTVSQILGDTDSDRRPFAEKSATGTPDSNYPE